MPALPDSARHLVIGAGVHGLSTAWHLADRGEEALVVDKAGVAAGASGIACGVIRNNYFQPAMQELMAACVEIWESDPDALSYHGSGYVALGPPAQEEELSEVFERQQRIGYPSELYTGEDEVAAHMSRPVRGLARRRADRLPPRARRRLRLQPRVDAGPCRQGPRRRGDDRRGRRGHRLLPGRLGCRRAGRDHRGGRPASTRSSSPSGRGSPRSGRCSGSPTASTCAGPTGPSIGISRCGPTGICRRGRWRCRPRR